MKEKLILIEDNYADVRLIRLILSQTKDAPELIHYETGKAFIDDINANTVDLSDVKLILLDYNLPMMNGGEILQKLQGSIIHKTPVVVLTSSNAPNDINSTYELGISGYVTKPLDLDDFESLIKAILDYWFKFNIIPKVEEN